MIPTYSLNGAIDPASFLRRFEMAYKAKKPSSDDLAVWIFAKLEGAILDVFENEFQDQRITWASFYEWFEGTCCPSTGNRAVVAINNLDELEKEPDETLMDYAECTMEIMAHGRIDPRMAHQYFLRGLPRKLRGLVTNDNLGENIIKTAQQIEATAARTGVATVAKTSGGGPRATTNQPRQQRRQQRQPHQESRQSRSPPRSRRDHSPRPREREPTPRRTPFRTPRRQTPRRAHEESRADDAMDISRVSQISVNTPSAPPTPPEIDELVISGNE